jgi:hypothetical protein
LGRVRLRVLAECYANKCFAEILEASIKGVASVDSIAHTAKMGRDKVLKESRAGHRRSWEGSSYY